MEAWSSTPGQAVVNEKTDDAVTHQQLLLEMEEQAGRSDALSRSLIDKESALGNLERKLEVRRQTSWHAWAPGTCPTAISRRCASDPCDAPTATLHCKTARHS